MPLIQKETIPLWGIWKIDETSDELLSQLEHHEWYLPFLQQHSMENRKKEWLAARVLLKELMGREVRISYLEQGAPYLPKEQLHISISHTKGYAAVLLGQNAALGIDIEYISDRVRKITSKFMSDEEMQHLDSEMETTHILLHWSAKETIFKALHREEVNFKHDLHISPFALSLSGQFDAMETRTLAHNKYVVNYQVTDNYVVTFRY